MSADNWAICPKCSGNHYAEQEKKYAAYRIKKDQVESSYGKIPAAEYIAAKAALDSMKEELDSTRHTPTDLREDYEQGMRSDGRYFARYYASCQNKGCGFEYTFKYDQKTWPAVQPAEVKIND